jgi:LPS export ABC transporter protein LptC
VLVVLVIAMACGRSAGPPTTAVAADSADQVLFGLTHNLTIDGVLRVRLEADTAYFYDPTQTAELFGVTVEFLSPEGKLTTTLTSREGTYFWRMGDMEARGNVVAVTPDRKELKTEILHYNRGRHEISGPAAFVFNGPGRHLEGDGFTADPEFENVEATGARRGTIRNVELRSR